MTPREEQLKLIRERVLAATFESTHEHVYGAAFNDCSMGRCEHKDRPITLADILLAINTMRVDYGIISSGEFIKYEVNERWSFAGLYWNLRKDDLNEQSPETLTFLSHLLK